MLIKKLVLGPLDTNCYILSGDGKNAVIIDPAEDSRAIRKVLEAERLTAEAVFLTHGHIDHTNAAKRLQSAGAKIFMNFSDKPLLFDDFGLGYPYAVEEFEPDERLVDEAELSAAGLKFRVIFTPGHSKGSVCFLVEGVLFSGDTLFRHHVGRTDLPSGNENALMQSIHKLYKLPPETRVFAGHGKETTIGYEMLNNYSVKKK